jgi:general secretion pathway protein F
MAVFEYIARTNAGEKVTGVLEAASEAAVLGVLGEKHLFPVQVAQQSERKTVGRSRKLRASELSAVFEQMADLLRAGVPLLRSLQTIRRMSSNKKLVAIIGDVADSVEAGESLADAMAEQSDSFNVLQVAMIRAGERGGFLEEVMVDLAGYLERQDTLRNKVFGSMVYPFLLMGVGMCVVVFFLIVLVPQFQQFLQGVELPLPSKILFGMSDMILLHWPMTLTGGILGVTALVLLVRSSFGQDLWIRFQLRIPVLGHTLLMLSTTRFCRILGTMLGSGVPIIQALTISRDAVGCPPLAKNIDAAIESVRGGKGLASPLREGKLLPPAILEMISVAEESNQLEKVLGKIADTVERRTNQRVDMIVRLLEPAVLILLAGLIFFIALGLLIPIFTMVKSLK